MTLGGEQPPQGLAVDRIRPHCPCSTARPTAGEPGQMAWPDCGSRFRPEPNATEARDARASAAQSLPIAVGRAVGHHRMVERLISGIGVVYSADGVRFARPVSTKSWPGHAVRDRPALERLLGPRRAPALSHPNIFYDVGKPEGQPSLMMRLLEGQTPKQSVAGKPLPEAEML